MTTVRFVEQRTSLQDGITRLLELVDEEFVPPLTSEKRSSVSRAPGEGGATDISGYIDRCLDRPMIGAFDDGRLVGFCSFERLEDSDALDEFTPTNHVEIIAVDEPHRGRGLATQMYQLLLTDLPPTWQAPSVSTKTWNTNDAHIAVLENLGFEEVARLAEDRGAGIDTLYFARRV
ncbi:GNAT family N-acetyltransferase [Haloarcula amylovorans]|uniref:GNAT family N-acetyltransferase n=1 Tax=Haloarcula amylovorans TaxID=2562280 RepID=UPI001076B2AA|nr:GNAT family N-acetyltransferase [Halomicroarcula amylolytica]